MKNIPEKNQQIIQVHAQLIVAVVQSLHDKSLLPQLQEALKVSEENGWKNLVAAIRKIMNGSRDASLLNGLDEEDGIIVDAILRGIQNPSTLPNPQQQQDPTLAAPMLAQMIHAAGRGDAQVLAMLGAMAEQMSRTKGDMARFSTLIKPMVDGERNIDKLCSKIGATGEKLVTLIIKELNKLELH
ncbi:MAG: hypothetical protein QG652_1011 [Pseudomonadota bacterium]|nr:hypothetical protein [Pseudomonadota bacterium]